MSEVMEGGIKYVKSPADIYRCDEKLTAVKCQTCSCFQRCSAGPLQGSFPRRIKEYVVKRDGGQKAN